MPSHFDHRPVLLEAINSLLEPRPGSLLVDATVGGGGHAAALLEASQPGGRLVGLDVDAEALRAAGTALARFGDRVRLVRASFRDLPAALDAADVGRVDAVLMDLGVSSPQLDRPERGFRFAEATADRTPLDMRMDDRLQRDAAALLAEASEEELARLFAAYGELRGARRLARAIVRARRESPIRDARDLLDLVGTTGVGRGRRHHPATRVFQALRIAVNDELEALRAGLEGAVEVLRPGGRLAVISYHSLEDRIVKRFFQREERGCVCPPSLPVCTCGRRPRLRVLTRRPVRPSTDEVRANPRARSARLRVAERIAPQGEDKACA